jgi:group I intron endonuclease
MNTGVYQIRNIINQKVYIGSAAGVKGFKGRWNTHLHYLRHLTHGNKHLQNAWNKYNEDAFVFEVLLYCDPEHCVWYEQLTIDHYKPKYNISPVAGSQLGFQHSDTSRLKISQAMRGELNHFYGKTHTENTKLKLKKARAKQQFSQATKTLWSRNRSGAGNTQAKLSTQDIDQIRKMLASDITQIEIANKFHVSPSTISRIKLNKSWKSC